MYYDPIAQSACGHDCQNYLKKYSKKKNLTPFLNECIIAPKYQFSYEEQHAAIEEINLRTVTAEIRKWFELRKYSSAVF